jgi:hypothetical protein
MKTPY